MELTTLLQAIAPADRRAEELAQRRWDSIAKPLGSLGRLEAAVVRIAGMRGTPQVSIRRRALVIMCADNGVVAEGVTQTGQEVTAAVTENFTRGATSVCAMARVAGCDLYPVDIGVAADLGDCSGLIRHKVARGTRNLLWEPAMTRPQAEDALCFGAQLAQELAGQGYELLTTGEMGIGNTTTSSAMAAVLLDRPVEEVTGRGAGLSTPGLRRKVEVIRAAIARHRPDPNDPLDVLAKVGGLDIAGLTGVFLGAAAARLPVLVDGFISAVAALAAVRLCPAAADYLLASHTSQEPAAAMLLEALGLSPFICADMRLGEGSGAVAAMPLLEMALAVYREMCTFQETEIEAYQPLK